MPFPGFLPLRILLVSFRIENSDLSNDSPLQQLALPSQASYKQLLMIDQVPPDHKP